MKFSTFNVDEINACSTKTLLTLYTFKNVQTTSVTSVIRNVPRSSDNFHFDFQTNVSLLNGP